MSVKAREFGATAAKKANEAAPIIGERMKSLASVIREKAAREGKIGTAAIKVDRERIKVLSFKGMEQL